MDGKIVVTLELDTAAWDDQFDRVIDQLNQLREAGRKVTDVAASIYSPVKVKDGGN